MKTYKNNHLKFTIEYPDAWQEVPNAWLSSLFSRARVDNKELEEAMKTSNGFFFVAQDPTAEEFLSVPILKCRLYNKESVIKSGGIIKTIEQFINFAKINIPDFKVISLNENRIVGGLVGFHVEFGMSTSNDKGYKYGSIAEMFYVFTNNYCFCVSISATSDPGYRPLEEIIAIIESIKFDKNA